jgi:hypothetical protein
METIVSSLIVNTNVQPQTSKLENGLRLIRRRYDVPETSFCFDALSQ